MASIVPYQIDALLETLPLSKVGALEPPSASELQNLYDRRRAARPTGGPARPGGGPPGR